jgi:sugar lactone lactonase YvrE
MNQMLPMLPSKVLPFFLLFLFSNQSLADAYADAREELMVAYQVRDFAAMQLAASKALQARPGYPGALFNLAFAKTLIEDHAGSLEILQGLVDSGVDYGVADIEELAALQSLPEWPAYAAAVQALNEPIGDAQLAFIYDAGDFVPEGIAVDGGDLLLGSIRHGFIERLGAQPATVSSPDAAGHWSVFGMRLGPAGGLWYVSAAVPEYANVDAENNGSTGLFRLDLKTGETTVRAVLPKQDAAMVLGDLVFAGDNTIYATESLTGALYRYTIDNGEFTQVIAPGTLRSMQGLVLDQSGKYLYVADYVGGLFRVHLADFSIQPVIGDDETNLFGIDGLYRYGNELIAIQNGIRPNRVVAFSLGADGLSISSTRILARNLPEFDEPTLGTIAGDEFLFVANSHWGRFDREGNLPEALSGPIILKIKL